MEQYVGLDVSLEETSICVLDESGTIGFEGDSAPQPDAIVKAIRRRAPNVTRIVFETGSLANW